MDKILLLSKLFSVSTDFLLNDDLEIEDQKLYDEDINFKTRKITMEMANEFINIKFKTAKLIALGVLLCILSTIVLFFLGVLGEASQD